MLDTYLDFESIIFFASTYVSVVNSLCLISARNAQQKGAIARKTFGEFAIA
jgi:hypothetical protein